MKRDTSDLICRRAFGRFRYCGRPHHQHTGPDLHCPEPPASTPRRRAEPYTFQRYAGSISRASLSLNDTEAHVLEELCKRALAGGDVRGFARVNAGAVGRLQAVAASVRARVARQQADADERERVAAE